MSLFLVFVSLFCFVSNCDPKGCCQQQLFAAFALKQFNFSALNLTPVRFSVLQLFCFCANAAYCCCCSAALWLVIGDISHFPCFLQGILASHRFVTTAFHVCLATNPLYLPSGDSWHVITCGVFVIFVSLTHLFPGDPPQSFTCQEGGLSHWVLAGLTPPEASHHPLAYLPPLDMRISPHRGISCG